MFTKKPERLSADQLILLKLDEIAKRLEDLTAVGEFIPETIIVGTEWFPYTRSFQSATIINDGGADLYLELNRTLEPPWDRNEPPIKMGESLKIDFRSRRYKTEGGYPLLYFICKVGTATVRIFGLV